MRDLEHAQACAQICRILGNPLAYRIVRAIGRENRRPIELSRELRASASAIVNQLKLLKAAGLVRYHSTAERRKGRIVRYWLTDPALLRLCTTSDEIISRLRTAR